MESFLVIFMILACLASVSLALDTTLPESLFESCDKRRGVSKGNTLRLDFMRGERGYTVNVTTCSFVFFAESAGTKLYYTKTMWQLVKDDLTSGSEIIISTSTSRDASTSDWTVGTTYTQTREHTVDKGDNIQQIRVSFRTTLNKMPYFNMFVAVHGEAAKSNLGVIIGATVGGIVAVVIIVVLVYFFCCRKKY